MTRIGQGGALVPSKGESVIPSKKEIIKDLVKWFAGEYGLDLAEVMFEPIDMSKLVEMWKKRKAKKTGGGGGVAVLLLAFVLLGGKKRKR